MIFLPNIFRLHQVIKAEWEMLAAVSSSNRSAFVSIRSSTKKMFQRLRSPLCDFTDLSKPKKATFPPVYLAWGRRSPAAGGVLPVTDRSELAHGVPGREGSGQRSRSRIQHICLPLIPPLHIQCNKVKKTSPSYNLSTLLWRQKSNSNILFFRNSAPSR